MTTPSPADVPRHVPRFFDPYHAPSVGNPAADRAGLRDEAHQAADRMVRALGSLRGSEQDLDLHLELYRREFARAAPALKAFNAAIDVADPTP